MAELMPIKGRSTIPYAVLGEFCVLGFRCGDAEGRIQCSCGFSASQPIKGPSYPDAIVDAANEHLGIRASLIVPELFPASVSAAARTVDRAARRKSSPDLRAAQEGEHA